MIVEQRTYTLYPGKVPSFLALYEAEGRDVQSSVLGHMVGYFTTDFGELNQVVHLWGYTDHAERDRRRAALFKEPAWRSYFDKVIVLIVRQESKILIPTAFSPIR